MIDFDLPFGPNKKGSQWFASRFEEERDIRVVFDVIWQGQSKRSAAYLCDEETISEEQRMQGEKKRQKYIFIFLRIKMVATFFLLFATTRQPQVEPAEL